MMSTHEDFEGFLRLLQEEGVEFVIVGGYAVAFHGYLRATQDMDLFFRNNRDNILRIIRAIRRFGIAVEDSQVNDFEDPSCIIRMGVPPVRIEMICGISGPSGLPRPFEGEGGGEGDIRRRSLLHWDTI